MAPKTKTPAAKVPKRDSTEGEPAKRPRGRPPGRGPGRTTTQYNITLKLDVLAWLRDHPDGPAAVADRVLRREMEREQRKK